LVARRIEFNELFEDELGLCDYIDLTVQEIIAKLLANKSKSPA